MTLKIKGTNEGFKTEALIEEYLNNKKIVDLKTSNLKKFIYFICNENDVELKKETIIKIKKFNKENLKIKIKGSPKTDKIFKIMNKEFRISVKSGKGNAFHEEQEETFVKFLKDDLNANNEIIGFLKRFLRDKNQKNKALKDTEFHQLLKKNKQKIINRVLSGIYGEPKVDYYCFCPKLESSDSKSDRINKIERCVFANHTSIVNYLVNNLSNSSCNVGALSFQAQNKKRSTNIQFKWSDPYNDFK